MVKGHKMEKNRDTQLLTSIFKVSHLSISGKLFLENQSHNLGLKLAHFFIKNNILN